MKFCTISLNLSRETELEKLQSQPLSALTPMDAFVQSMRLHHLLYPIAMLSYLEDMVEAVNTLPGTRSLKEGLRSEDRFPQSFSELQMAYAFAHAGFPIVLSPPVGAGRLDLQATVEGVPILIEVITPDMFKPLRYSTKAVMVPNRAAIKSMMNSRNILLNCRRIRPHQLLLQLTLDDQRSITSSWQTIYTALHNSLSG